MNLIEAMETAAASGSAACHETKEYAIWAMPDGGWRSWTVAMGAHVSSRKSSREACEDLAERHGDLTRPFAIAPFLHE